MMDDRVRAALAAGDAELAGQSWLSLSPERTHARKLVELVPSASLRADVRSAVARGLVAIGLAVRRNFPDNLFCDLDLVLEALERGGAANGPSWVAETCAAFESLHDIFGQHTTIRFRYVHDFLYGFDWARWVAHDRVAHACVGPFDPVFLAHVRKRGGEIIELIAQNDAKYPRLMPGEHRNPFPFARDPSSEAKLLRDLAMRGWIPVEAWRRGATPVWDRQYAAERERRARELCGS